MENEFTFDPDVDYSDWTEEDFIRCGVDPQIVAAGILTGGGIISACIATYGGKKKDKK